MQHVNTTDPDVRSRSADGSLWAMSDRYNMPQRRALRWALSFIWLDRRVGPRWNQ